MKRISHLDFLRAFLECENQTSIMKIGEVKDIEVFCGYDVNLLPVISLKNPLFMASRNYAKGKLSTNIVVGTTAYDVYLTITLEDKTLESFFAVFGSALLDEIDVSNDDPSDIVDQYLDSWEYVFKNPRIRIKQSVFWENFLHIIDFWRVVYLLLVGMLITHHLKTFQ